MPRLVFIGLVTLSVGYLALCALVFFFQRSLIYFPQPKSVSWGASEMRLATDEGEMLVSARERGGDAAVLYFGGNAEDVSGSMPGMQAAFPDSSVYLMHYRGYGGSSGKPTETALFADAEAMYVKVAAKHKDIVVIGRSLGSGVAVYLASRRPVTRLVLVTPYDSLAEIGARQFPFLLVRWLLADKYESSKYVASITAPTTIIAAEHDGIIPRESSQRLITRFVPGLVSFHVIPGTGHNNISFNDEYWRLLSVRDAGPN